MDCQCKGIGGLLQMREKKITSQSRLCFFNFHKIYIYGNPVTENEIESTDKSILWSDIEEWIEDANFLEESKFEQEIVPLDGTDISNITEDLQKLVVPCYCFYNKPMEADELEPRAEKYEVLKVIKNVGLECQVRFEYNDWNGKY